MKKKPPLSIRTIAGILFLIGFITAYWQWLAYRAFIETEINLDSVETILISKGDTVNRLASDWQKEGIIQNAFYFKIMCWLNPELQKIRVGEYALSDAETPKSLMEKLSRGEVIQYPITIIEGMNSFQILDMIRSNALLNDDLKKHPLDLVKALGIESDHIEGWIYPDTYHFTRGESATSILKRSVKTMQSVLEKEWQNRDDNLPYNSPYEALIMASIIEKETSIDSEREEIAGVFVRRLQKKMRLQTDPTVIYGIGPDFNGDITYRDLKTKTPYNTYMINGLPPTPIAMPGRRSIYAALHPAEGETLYFVATGDGGHYFSKTVEEHNQAVKRYLKKLRSRK